MKKVLIFFGSKEYNESKKRLFNSAKKYFDEIIAYDEKDIDIEFYNANITIFKDRRGWGYWLWKPYFILKTLQQLSENDLCFYADATSVFISSPDILFDKCQTNEGIVLFENAHFKNYQWTKGDCFYLMDLRSERYIYGKQVDAAFQIYKKNKRSLLFVNEYLKNCTNYNIISDTPNEFCENHPDFKDHRHDQSVLSLLAIKHEVTLVKSPRRHHSEFDLIIDLKRDVTKLPY